MQHFRTPARRPKSESGCPLCITRWFLSQKSGLLFLISTDGRYIRFICLHLAESAVTHASVSYFPKLLVLLWPFVLLEVSLVYSCFLKMWLFIYLFCPVCSAYGMVSRPGIEPTPTQWKQKPLPLSHQGTSLVYSLQWFFFFLGGGVVGGFSRRLRGKNIYLLCLMKIPSSGILWFFFNV